MFVWTPCCSSRPTPNNSPVVPPGFISVPIRMTTSQATGKKKKKEGKRDKKGKMRDSRDSTTMHFLLDTSFLPQPPSKSRYESQDSTSTLSDTSDSDPRSSPILPSPIPAPRTPQDLTRRRRILRLIIWDTILCIGWMGVGIGCVIGGQKCPAGTGAGWWCVAFSLTSSEVLMSGIVMRTMERWR